METILSIVMLGALAMIAGAIYLWRKGRYTRQVVLMLVLAAIMIGNVLILTIPAADSAAPTGRAAAR
jgi:drug/metabolite transporter superfamily protein YnfA